MKTRPETHTQILHAAGINVSQNFLTLPHPAPRLRMHEPQPLQRHWPEESDSCEEVSRQPSRGKFSSQPVAPLPTPSPGRHCSTCSPGQRKAPGLAWQYWAQRLRWRRPWRLACFHPRPPTGRSRRCEPQSRLLHGGSAGEGAACDSAATQGPAALAVNDILWRADLGPVCLKAQRPGKLLNAPLFSWLLQRLRPSVFPRSRMINITYTKED